MKKIIIGLVIFFIVSSASSQNPVFFEQNGDTIIFYLSCNGSLTNKDNATYKRKTFIEKKKLAFYGSVTDYYYPIGAIAFKAHYQNGFYSGDITNYYKNGSIKVKGIYKNNKRDSIWTFYYKNQVIEKKIDYSNGQQKLIEYYKKNGNPVFLDGNGTYKGLSNKDYFSCEQYKIKGDVKDGIMTGRWTINFGYSVSTEVFENGRFIRGFEAPYDRSYDNVSLINPSGFPYFENITILNYLIACNKPGFYWPTYNKVSIEKGFLIELEQEIKDNINTNDFFYALLEFQLNDGIVDANSFKSITNDKQKANELKNLILSLEKWDKTKDNLSFTIYLPVFWENGLIYLKPKDMLKFN